MSFENFDQKKTEAIKILRGIVQKNPNGIGQESIKEQFRNRGIEDLYFACAMYTLLVLEKYILIDSQNIIKAKVEPLSQPATQLAMSLFGENLEAS